VPIGNSFDDFLKEHGMFALCTAAAKKSTLETAPFDVADYLDDEATVAAYLSVAKADPNPSVYLQAVKDVERTSLNSKEST
jgi:hypothetical protein